MNHVIKKVGSLILAVSSILLVSCQSGEQKTDLEKPNVLLIMTDDQGYADYGAYSQKEDVYTPHLDRLAQSGVRFTNAYASMSICSPSRMAVMTGRQQQRWGVYNYGANLPESEITLAEQLRANGYQTGKVGKSHYGSYKGPGVHEYPTGHGFEYFFGKEGGTMDYLRHKAAHREGFTTRMANHLGIGPFWENDQQVDREGYSTDIILEKSLAYIDQHKENPFFLMVSFNAVHLFTHQIPAEDLKAMGIEEVPDWDPSTGGWDEYLEWYVNTVKPNTPEGRQRYLYHLNKLDQAIGSLLDKLENEGLKKNTIVLFLSDNGGSPRTYADNSPLKGNKYILEEGGIRIPFVMSWPDKLQAGLVYDKMVSGLDVFPTLHAALDIPLPNDRTIDGENLLPYLCGEKQEDPREWLFWTGFHLKGKPRTYEKPNTALERHDKTYNGDDTGWAVRHKNWKLRYYGRSDQYGLFNLSDDIGENNNLATQHPELVEKLKKGFFDWHETIKKDHVKYNLPESSEF